MKISYHIFWTFFTVSVAQSMGNTRNYTDEQKCYNRSDSYEDQPSLHILAIVDKGDTYSSEDEIHDSGNLSESYISNGPGTYEEHENHLKSLQRLADVPQTNSSNFPSLSGHWSSEVLNRDKFYKNSNLFKSISESPEVQHRTVWNKPSLNSVVKTSGNSDISHYNLKTYRKPGTSVLNNDDVIFVQPIQRISQPGLNVFEETDPFSSRSRILPGGEEEVIKVFRYQSDPFQIKPQQKSVYRYKRPHRFLKKIPIYDTVRYIVPYRQSNIGSSIKSDKYLLEKSEDNDMVNEPSIYEDTRSSSIRNPYIKNSYHNKEKQRTRDNQPMTNFQSQIPFISSSKSHESNQRNGYSNATNKGSDLNADILVSKLKSSLEDMLEKWLQKFKAVLCSKEKLNCSEFNESLSASKDLQNTKKPDKKSSDGKITGEKTEPSPPVSRSEFSDDINHITMDKFQNKYISNISISNVSEQENRMIVGGDKVDIEKFPYQVAIFLNGSFLCGGAIIDDKVVLTAAHCFERTLVAEEYYVKAGITHLDDNGQRRNAIKIFRHEKYVDVRDYDIAILLVDKPFEFNSNVAKVKLPDDLCVKDGDNVIITGYGKTAIGSTSNRQLFGLSLPLTSREKCMDRKLNGVKKINITSRHICTGSPVNQGTCYGDSGGPVVKDGYILGITSFGIPCATGDPEIFTNVTYFLKWIKNTISNS